MFRSFVFAAGLLLTQSSALCQTSARLLPGMGEVRHPVTTKNPEAQRYFDQGMALIFGFNHEEAARSFQRAAELDPQMAMAWWGVALAVGPNYNLPVDPQREMQAYNAVQKALLLSANAPKHERAYIQALARRYTNQPTTDYLPLERAYNNAMRELSRAYPDDLDAATLFAESGMNLRPWRLWNADGTPAPGTEEVLVTLESVLRRDPNHIGANHYYIHAVEASGHPERGLPSAQRLAALAPGAGHLVHMPGHIYIRTGDHEAGARTNELAAAADERYLKQTKTHGFYPMMYYTHNLHFIAVENAMMGRYADAMKAAHRVQAHVAPHAAAMPMLDGFNPLPTLVLVRFQRWGEVLNLPQPAVSLPMSRGLYHYARGLAFASQGNVGQAQTELASLRRLAPEMGKIPTNPQGPRNAGLVAEIAAEVLQARIARVQRNGLSEIEHLRRAVGLEDSMDYTEPPDWFYPLRESLGAALLRNGNAVEAEKVFRADLVRNPRNGRSLFGLMESLKGQHRDQEAHLVQQQYQTAWKNADTQLSISEM